MVRSGVEMLSKQNSKTVENVGVTVVLKKDWGMAEAGLVFFLEKSEK